LCAAETAAAALWCVCSGGARRAVSNQMVFLDSHTVSLILVGKCANSTRWSSYAHAPRPAPATRAAASPALLCVPTATSNRKQKTETKAQACSVIHHIIRSRCGITLAASRGCEIGSCPSVCGQTQPTTPGVRTWQRPHTHIRMHTYTHSRSTRLSPGIRFEGS